MNNQPKTWDELLEAGYVIELTEEQIGIARARFSPEPKKFSYADNDHLKGGHEAEEKMRKKYQGSK